MIKAKEKALEQEVSPRARCPQTSRSSGPDATRVASLASQVPKRVALETRIAHAEKTIRNADAMIPKVEADERKKADVIKGLKADLARFEKAAKEAEGEPGS